MSKARMSLFIATLLGHILISACSLTFQGDPVVEEIGYYPSITSSVMCGDYDSSSGTPFDVKTVFSLQDARAIAFVRYASFVPDETLLSFKFYRPNGEFYGKLERTVNWSSGWYCCWYSISGFESRWISNPGQWRCDILVDQKLQGVLNFSVRVP